MLQILLTMFQGYLKVALRSFVRQKIFLAFKHFRPYAWHCQCRADPFVGTRRKKL
jgi:hypothetical protein